MRRPEGPLLPTASTPPRQRWPARSPPGRRAPRRPLPAVPTRQRGPADIGPRPERQRDRRRPHAGRRCPGLDAERRAAPAGWSVLCSLFGSTTPFTQQQLAQLYGTKSHYRRPSTGPACRRRLRRDTCSLPIGPRCWRKPARSGFRGGATCFLTGRVVTRCVRTGRVGTRLS